MFRLTPIFIFLALLFSSCEKEIISDDRSKASKIMKKVLAERFGLGVKYLPLIYSEQWNHWVSTVYYNDKLYRLYLNNDGSIENRVFQIEQPPRGMQKVLVVLVNYKALAIAENLPLWEEAQQEINEEHAAYAMAQGFEAPIVQFQNTNALADSAEIHEYTLQNVEQIVNKRGIFIRDFDIVALVDLNTTQPSGGFGDYQARFVKIGWFYGNIPNQTDELNKEKMKGIAYALYHHEIGHVWGWEHEWSDADTVSIFITNPVLFGWEDMNGNGTPEILDANPYGIK